MNGVVVIGGKEHALRFSVNHVCVMEETEGKALPALMDGSLLGMRALLWCGLMEEGITRQQAGEMLQCYFTDGGSVKELAQVLAQALSDAGYFHLSEEEG